MEARKMATAGGRIDIGGGGFIASRWRGNAPLATLFWRDMLLVGTAINIVATIAALILLSLGAPAWISMAVYVSPLSWNVFLVLAVHRTADRQQAAHAAGAKAGSLIWLLAATLL